WASTSRTFTTAMACAPCEDTRAKASANAGRLKDGGIRRLPEDLEASGGDGDGAGARTRTADLLITKEPGSGPAFRLPSTGEPSNAGSRSACGVAYELLILSASYKELTPSSYSGEGARPGLKRAWMFAAIMLTGCATVSSQ